ncbi:MAG: DUF4290 domain-containing protein [Bacteroidota bacterium]|nr:DUF4290 domain-containing protein [Bacteroidota bacterium]
MEYNSTRDKLIIPEYGRNIQKLIKYTIGVEDRQKRTVMAHLIVDIMSQTVPASRDSGDYKRKLWDHMYIISDFKLDVDGPYPPPPEDILTEKPKRLPYSHGEIRFPHYGKNLEDMIRKAVEFEEGEEKKALIITIANHMKKSYLNWNRDSVNDNMIKDHLELLSNGKIKLGENVELNSTSDILSKSRQKRNSTRARRRTTVTGKKGRLINNLALFFIL